MCVSRGMRELQCGVRDGLGSKWPIVGPRRHRTQINTLCGFVELGAQSSKSDVDEVSFRGLLNRAMHDRRATGGEAYVRVEGADANWM